MAISATKVSVWNRALDRIGETDAVESEDENRPAAAVCARHWDDVLRELLEARPWPWATRQLPLLKVDTQSYSAPSNGVIRDFVIPFPLLDASKLTATYISPGGGETALAAVTDYTLTLAQGGTPAFVTLGVAPATGTIRLTVAVSRVGWKHVYNLPADCITPLALLYKNTRFSLLPVASRVEFAVVANDGGDGLLLCCNLDSTEFQTLEYVALIDYVPAMPRQFIDALAWRLAAELAAALKKDPKLAQYCLQLYAASLDMASAQAQNVGEEDVRPTTPSIAARG